MNAAALTLRLGNSADAEMIAAMSRIFVEDGLPWIWRPGKVAAEIEKRDTTVLVALDGRHMVGFAIMHFGDGSAHLNLLTVHPEYRRSGVGRRMIEWLEKSARVAGIFSISLEVRTKNTDGREFYRAVGYRETTTLHRYYQGLEDAVRMHHDLSVNAHSR